MTSDYEYTDYLRSKKTVDDRSINKDVFATLRKQLAGRGRIIEIGAGLGTMVARLIEWRLAPKVSYRLMDVDPVLLADSRTWLSDWAKAEGLTVSPTHSGGLRLCGKELDWFVEFTLSELGALLERPDPSLRADLLIANAFLDIVEVPVVLPQLFAALLAKDGLFWFSINFDGDTIFEPGHASDEQFMKVYHRSMDQRIRYGRPAGDSRTGRHLFSHLRSLGAQILAAGSSDWVVFGDLTGQYPAAEKQFLRHILETVDQELRKHAEIDRLELAQWMEARLAQLQGGQLVYLAHQLDFVGRPKPG